MVDHKIQSSSGLQLELSQVPKMLRKLTLEWAPNSYVISFKLETDEEILFDKAWKAICNYRVNLVVANLLHTRTNVCYLIYDQKIVSTNISKHEEMISSDHHRNINNRSVEIVNKEQAIIETMLVAKVIEKHLYFYSQSVLLGSSDSINSNNSCGANIDALDNNVISHCQRYIVLINTGGV